MNVLFLCTGNSCRSILAEATFNHLAPEGWHGMSAGSHPTGHVHPRSLALLAREGITTEGYYSKSWENLPQVPDIPSWAAQIIEQAWLSQQDDVQAIARKLASANCAGSSKAVCI